MNVLPTPLPGAVMLEPRVFDDARGFFLELHAGRRFRELGLPAQFVQMNHSRSRANALRGLHYQVEHVQGKLVSVVRGEIFDVAVDLREGSPTFGQWTGVILSDTNHRQLYVPPGMAHGFCVLSELADVVYGCTDYYSPEHERTILWNDGTLAIEWPVADPLVSEKDRRGLPFSDAPRFPAEAPGVNTLQFAKK